MSKLIIGIFLFNTFAWLPVHATSEKAYKVGIVPQFDTRKIRKIWLPILKQIEKDTGCKFILKGSPTISKFEQEFNSGEFDFAYMNPYHVLLANQSQGYIPLVRDVNRKLYGVLVVKKDSSIKSFHDLDGKLVVFPAPNALGASLLIRAELKENYNINFRPKYVKTHTSVYLNVALGQADAGGGVQKTFEKQKENIKSKLKILYETSKVPPHPFLAHPRVDDSVRKAVYESLLSLGKTEKGKQLLRQIPISKVGQATIEDYMPLKNMGLDRYYIKSNK